MEEQDVANKGYIKESDFKYIIAKQKKEYWDKLMKEQKMLLFHWEGTPDLPTKISTSKIQEILRKEFELSEELKITLNIIAQKKRWNKLWRFYEVFQIDDLLNFNSKIIIKNFIIIISKIISFY